jgi:hypothetical protein
MYHESRSVTDRRSVCPPVACSSSPDHPLFAEGVETLLREQPGLEVVGSGDVSPQTFARIQEMAPDVVVVGASGDEQDALVARVFQALPGLKVVALNLDDNRIHIHYRQTKVGRQVEDLVEAIRQPLEWGRPRPAQMRIFAVIQGHYGQRIVENIRAHGPRGWTVECWRAPELPAMIDDPESYLPLHVPPADLILALGESPAVAQLIPTSPDGPTPGRSLPRWTTAPGFRRGSSASWKSV